MYNAINYELPGRISDVKKAVTALQATVCGPAAADRQAHHGARQQPRGHRRQDRQGRQRQNRQTRHHHDRTGEGHRQMSADMQQPTSEQMLAAKQHHHHGHEHTRRGRPQSRRADRRKQGIHPRVQRDHPNGDLRRGLAAELAGGGVALAGHADIGEYIIFAGGVLTGGFGVAYNPLRMAGKELSRRNVTASRLTRSRLSGIAT